MAVADGTALLQHVPRRDASNTRLLRLCKLLYFMNGFSASSFGRFATIFYVQVAQLNASQIGAVEASQPIASAIGNQLFGVVADRLQSKKVISLLTQLVSTCLLMLLMLPQVQCCMGRILAVMVAVSFFGVGGGVLDSYTLDLLGVARRGEYGRYRLWLAISWGVGNAGMGAVAKVNFNYNFIAMAVLNAAAILMMAMALPRRTQQEKILVAERSAERAHAAAAADDDVGAMSNSARGSTTLRNLLCQARMIAFLVHLMLLGFGFTVVEKFLFVFALDELGADSTLCGYSVAVTVIFEIPIFQFGAQLVERLGHDAMMWLATASYVARVFGYTRLEPHTVWYLL